MNLTGEKMEDRRIKTNLKDFIKIYEKNNKCKILNLEVYNDGAIIKYKRNRQYFIIHYPKHLLNI